MEESLKENLKESLNLYQKLAKVRAMSDVVAKEKRGYNYTYADITSILAKITAGMKRYGVSLIPLVTPGTGHVEQLVTKSTKFDKTGKAYENVVTEMLVTADMVFRWVNDDNPDEFIDVPWFLTGAQGDPSQAYGSGLTYCTRYFLTSYFQIAQADSDVDAYRTKQKVAAAAEDKAIAEEIIKEFDKILQSYMSEHPESSDDIKKFVSRYVKDSDYFKLHLFRIWNQDAGGEASHVAGTPFEAHQAAQHGVVFGLQKLLLQPRRSAKGALQLLERRNHQQDGLLPRVGAFRLLDQRGVARICGQTEKADGKSMVGGLLEWRRALYDKYSAQRISRASAILQL